MPDVVEDLAGGADVAIHVPAPQARIGERQLQGLPAQCPGGDAQPDALGGDAEPGHAEAGRHRQPATTCFRSVI